MAREPMIGDVWTKKCFVPPDIRDEVLREILLRMSSQVQTMMMLLDVDNHLSDLAKRDQGGANGDRAGGAQHEPGPALAPGPGGGAEHGLGHGKREVTTSAHNTHSILRNH